MYLSALHRIKRTPRSWIFISSGVRNTSGQLVGEFGPCPSSPKRPLDLAPAEGVRPGSPDGTLWLPRLTSPTFPGSPRPSGQPAGAGAVAGASERPDPPPGRRPGPGGARGPAWDGAAGLTRGAQVALGARRGQCAGSAARAAA